MTHRRALLSCLVTLSLALGCGSSDEGAKSSDSSLSDTGSSKAGDAGRGHDAGHDSGKPRDAGAKDTGTKDGGSKDAGADPAGDVVGVYGFLVGMTYDSKNSVIQTVM